MNVGIIRMELAICIFLSANSVDPDEMPHYHLGLHCSVPTFFIELSIIINAHTYIVCEVVIQGILIFSRSSAR